MGSADTFARFRRTKAEVGQDALLPQTMPTVGVTTAAAVPEPEPATQVKFPVGFLVTCTNPVCCTSSGRQTQMTAPVSCPTMSCYRCATQISAKDLRLTREQRQQAAARDAARDAAESELVLGQLAVGLQAAERAGEGRWAVELQLAEKEKMVEALRMASVHLCACTDTQVSGWLAAAV